VTFDYRNDSGLNVTKQFSLNPNSYTVELKADVSQNGTALRPTILWGPGLGDSDSQTGRYAVKPEALFSSGGSVSRVAASKIASQPSYDQEFDYAGIDDHYFAAFAVKPGQAKLTYQPLQVPPPANSTDPARDLMAFSIEPAQAQPLTFYAGPKDFDTLAAIDRNLVKAINFGMFSVIVVPLLRSLNWIHSYVGNYGWAIFILTLLINIVLFPLNHKSVVSMRKMQEIQPEAKAIQERYSKLKATDPAKQKMNQELMALYRDNGVNPASGCIPMLLILPVFLAFYALLTTAIELRGAPFVGWIHDLSLPDPYYVLPILVGASQVLTQWMTPQAGVDPAQQKMMMIMPVVLIFVFVSTPAGALIYWLVGNVWRIGQMQLTNYIHPPKVHVVRPAAERRVKRVGGGKTDAAREN
jgi:YidC/Oxa1 family membrane protein insertase